ncbi:hypothetical protein B0H10DRAFT_2008309, partial [Mycena sp. CBHHK59/15]
LRQMFTKVTKQMSHSSTPTLPWVLPMGMLKHLLSSKDNLNLDVRLCTAAEAGLGKLEVYYSKARNCQLHSIATCTYFICTSSVDVLL